MNSDDTNVDDSHNRSSSHNNPATTTTILNHPLEEVQDKDHNSDDGDAPETNSLPTLPIHQSSLVVDQTIVQEEDVTTTTLDASSANLSSTFLSKNASTLVTTIMDIELSLSTTTDATTTTSSRTPRNSDCTSSGSAHESSPAASSCEDDTAALVSTAAGGVSKAKQKTTKSKSAAAAKTAAAQRIRFKRLAWYLSFVFIAVVIIVSVPVAIVVSRNKQNNHEAPVSSSPENNGQEEEKEGHDNASNNINNNQDDNEDDVSTVLTSSPPPTPITVINVIPSQYPSTLPSSGPSSGPSFTLVPSSLPTGLPSRWSPPTRAPTLLLPTFAPSMRPSTALPTLLPFSRAQTVAFFAIGDVPYTAQQAVEMDIQIQELRVQDDNSSEHVFDFVIHIGDIRSGTTDLDCSLQDYTATAEILRKSPVPVFIVLGDNEWNDCPNRNAAWGYWMDTFQGFESRYWNHTFQIERMENRSETFAFTHKGTLFVGLNLVGGMSFNDVEWSTRLSSQAAWTMDLIRRHVYTSNTTTATTATGMNNTARNSSTSSLFGSVLGPSSTTTTPIVIFGHVNPLNHHDDFFIPLRGFIRDELADNVPVLYLNGDKHEWSHDVTFYGQPNWSRIMLTGGTSEPPLKVYVTSSQRGDVGTTTASSSASDAFTYDRQL